VHAARHLTVMRIYPHYSEKTQNKYGVVIESISCNFRSLAIPPAADPHQ
jgi:hypothetical protein